MNWPDRPLFWPESPHKKYLWPERPHKKYLWPERPRKKYLWPERPDEPAASSVGSGVDFFWPERPYTIKIKWKLNNVYHLNHLMKTSEVDDRYKKSRNVSTLYLFLFSFPR